MNTAPGPLSHSKKSRRSFVSALAGVVERSAHLARMGARAHDDVYGVDVRSLRDEEDGFRIRGGIVGFWRI